MWAHDAAAEINAKEENDKSANVTDPYVRFLNATDRWIIFHSATQLLYGFSSESGIATQKEAAFGTVVREVKSFLRCTLRNDGSSQCVAWVQAKCLVKGSSFQASKACRTTSSWGWPPGTRLFLAGPVGIRIWMTSPVGTPGPPSSFHSSSRT